MRPRLLDLFCGAGGAAMGYHRAGFDVVGVDIKPQPRYPFEFVQADALVYMERFLSSEPQGVAFGDAAIEEVFDAIHASPPCQFHTEIQVVARNADAHPELIGPIRELLEQTGLPYIIENVSGARAFMREQFTLCGSMFGLGVDGRQLRRHRLFETNWPVGLLPQCQHQGKTVGVYGDHLRWGRRSSDGQESGPRALELGFRAMGVDWMSWDELKESIPPAYAELIGHQLLQHIRATEREVVTSGGEKG